MHICPTLCMTHMGTAVIRSAVLRCACVQLYVVKLHRKPLFPGIYTPVTITNNERLIREIREKKAGG